MLMKFAILSGCGLGGVLLSAALLMAHPQAPEADSPPSPGPAPSPGVDVAPQRPARPTRPRIVIRQDDDAKGPAVRFIEPRSTGAYSVAIGGADGKGLELPGMASVDRFFGLRKQSPEVQDARQKLRRLLGPDADRDQVRDAVAELFDALVDHRRDEVQKLEERLAKLKGQLEDKEGNRESEIDERVEELISGGDDFWGGPASGAMGPSKFFFNGSRFPGQTRFDEAKITVRGDVDVDSLATQLESALAEVREANDKLPSEIRVDKMEQAADGLAIVVERLTEKVFENASEESDEGDIDDAKALRAEIEAQLGRLSSRRETFKSQGDRMKEQQGAMVDALTKEIEALREQLRAIKQEQR